jgi:tRNA(Ile)-lysidine synthase
MRYPSDIHREVHQRLRTPAASYPLRILLAISGGADSIALAIVLQDLSVTYPLELYLAHFNHQLRGAESDADEDFVRQFAAHHKLPLRVMRQATQPLATASSQNLEATARQLRYDFLAATAQEIAATLVATAHNLNDQAETLLLRLLRGSGRQGLTGMAAYRPLTPGANINLVRPLLKVSRARIEAFLSQRGIAYCQDASNTDPQFTRNRLRQEVLPLLATFNPNIVTTLARTADILQQDFSPLLPLAQPRGYLELAIAPLQQASPGTRYHHLRNAINEVQGHLRRITQQHLIAIENLLLPGKSGKYLELPQGLIVRREFDKLIIATSLTINGTRLASNNCINNQTITPILALGESQTIGNLLIAFLPLPGIESSPEHHDRITNLTQGLAPNYYAVVDQQLTGDKLQIRYRQPGDRYCPNGHQKPQKLKKLWQQYRIPNSARDDWPILTTAAGALVWLPGLPLAQDVSPNATTTHFAIILAK